MNTEILNLPEGKLTVTTPLIKNPSARIIFTFVSREIPSDTLILSLQRRAGYDAQGYGCDSVTITKTNASYTTHWECSVSCE